MSDTSRPTAGGCGCLALVLVFNLWVGTISTKYLVTTWLHKPIATAPACVIGLVGGQAVVPAAIVTLVLVKTGVVQP